MPLGTGGVWPATLDLRKFHIEPRLLRTKTFPCAGPWITRAAVPHCTLVHRRGNFQKRKDSRLINGTGKEITPHHPNPLPHWGEGTKKNPFPHSYIFLFHKLSLGYITPSRAWQTIFVPKLELGNEGSFHVMFWVYDSKALINQRILWQFLFICDPQSTLVCKAYEMCSQRRTSRTRALSAQEEKACLSNIRVYISTLRF